MDLDFAKAEIRTAKSGFPYLSFPYREDHAGALVRPRIKVGDGLWWKETWAETESDAGPVIAYRAGGSRIHCASGESRLGTLVNYLGPDPDSETYEVDRWKSSMFMPRWAARYSNTVTRVLAERIQSISEADSIAEGIIGLGDNFQGHNPFSFGLFGWPEADWKTSARDAYFELWRRINCEDSLEANPLVWGYDWQFPQGRDMTRCHVMQAE